MTVAQICITATIIVYLCFVICTGVWIGRRSKKSAEGFYLGGRGLGPLVTAMSAEASDMSSWLLMGLPGVAYLSGVADASWTAIGLALGTYLNFLLVAKRIRRYSVQLDAITIPSFISKRYGEKKPVIMCIASLVILIFFVPYVASGLAAIGKLFNSLFGWNYMLAVVIGAVVIISYTSVGGFSAVATMDLIQSIIMTTALVIITVFGISQAGGVDAVVENAKSMAGYLSFVQIHDPTTGTAKPYELINIASMLAWGLGYFGMPHILVRFMAIRDEKELSLSRRIAAVWVVISMTVAVCIGMIGNSVSKAGSCALVVLSSILRTVVILLSETAISPKRDITHTMNIIRPGLHLGALSLNSRRIPAYSIPMKGSTTTMQASTDIRDTQAGESVMTEKREDIPNALRLSHIPMPKRASKAVMLPDMPIRKSSAPMHMATQRPRAFQNPPVLLTPSRTPLLTRWLTSLASLSIFL